MHSGHEGLAYRAASKLALKRERRRTQRWRGESMWNVRESALGRVYRPCQPALVTCFRVQGVWWVVYGRRPVNYIIGFGSEERSEVRAQAPSRRW